MCKPMHPGQFIKETYITPYNISVRQGSDFLDVSPSTLNNLINGNSNISALMAIRLSAVFGRSPESWLAMQNIYDLYIAKQKPEFIKFKSKRFVKE